MAEGDTGLFAVLSELLMPIDDGHVSLSRESEDFSPAIERGILTELERAFATQTEIVEFDVFLELTIDQFQATLGSYLDNSSLNARGAMTWATINGNTGYVSISAMTGFAKQPEISNDANGTMGSEGSPMTSAQDLAAAEQAIDQALNELGDVDKLIVDVRFNGGGDDAISLAFANRFTDSRQRVLTKTARSLNYETPPVQAWLEPTRGEPFLKPVVVIAGRDTASAAEIFVIAMRQLPNVTVLGETTNGALSNILHKPLPNGWNYGLSNEVYLDAAGTSFEHIGVPPDIPVPVFRISDIKRGMV